MKEGELDRYNRSKKLEKEKMYKKRKEQFAEEDYFDSIEKKQKLNQYKKKRKVKDNFDETDDY